MSTDNTGPWLTTEQVAQMLNRSPATIRRWIKAGRLPGHQPTGDGPYLIDPADLDALVPPLKRGWPDRIAPQ